MAESTNSKEIKSNKVEEEKIVVDKEEEKEPHKQLSDKEKTYNWAKITLYINSETHEIDLN